jgi:DNA-directed RNA polymerase subunit RPC12/RpoP
MKCAKCGTRVLKKGRLPGEAYVIINRYIVLKARSGAVIAACPKCGEELDLMSKGKPLVVRVKR